MDVEIKTKLSNLLYNYSKNNMKEIKEINETTRFIEDLGFNSINFIKIVILIEIEFDFEFDDDYLTFDKVSTFSDLLNYILFKIRV